MITIEVEGNELVLRNGEKQLRVALPEYLVEKAGGGALAFGLIGNPETGGAALVLAETVAVGGDYFLNHPPYQPCTGAVHINDANTALGVTYNATLTVTPTTATLNTLTLTIGDPVPVKP
jgi:hypothetical protein